MRDPNDKTANAIIAVAGLRLSNRALGDLNRQNGMTPQVRADAQEQVKQLRENMGDAPTAVVPTKRTFTPSRNTPKDVKEAGAKDNKPDTPAKGKTDGDKNDPFGGLLK